MTNELYDAVKREQINSETVTRIYGRILGDDDQTTRADESGGGSRFPIRWCLCVQDSPSSPCFCRPLIVWLRRLDVVASGESDRKDGPDENLSFFDLSNDAELLLERLQPLTTADARKIASMSPSQVDKLLTSSTGLAGVRPRGPQTIEDNWSTPDQAFDTIMGALTSAIDWQALVEQYKHR